MPAAVTAQHTFTFGESRSCSRMTCGFSVPQKMVLCRLTCPLVWKVALSVNAIRFTILVGYSSFWLKSGSIPREHTFAPLSKPGWLGCGTVTSWGPVSRFATLFFAESLFPNCTVWSILMDFAIWLAAQQQCSGHFYLFWAVLRFLGSCPLPIQSSQTLHRHDKLLNGLVDLVLQIVLQTFDGLRLANHTLPSSLQTLFFAPVLICHPWHRSICRRKIIH